MPEPQTAAVFTFGVWFPHPDFCSNCADGYSKANSHDIAIVNLFIPVNLPRYATLPALGAIDGLPNNTPVDLVGYGAQFDSGGGPRMPYDGGLTRHFAEAQLIPSNHRISDEFVKISANPARGKGGICFGDSGGPNLLAGTDTVVAINSRVTNNNCAGITYSKCIDLEYALNFINAFSP